MKHLSIIMLVVMALCVGCQMKWSPGDDASRHVLEIQRFDRLQYRYLTTGDFSALQQMSTEYPMETRTLIENVLQLGEATDPDINRTLLKHYQDTTLQTIITDAEAKYASMDTLNLQMTQAFERLQQMLPNMRVPMVYAQLSSLDQSIVVGDHSVGVSLDKYLGTDYAAYRRFGYTDNQRAQMKPEYIVPDVLTYYLISLYPLRDFDSRSQTERDLYMGKIQWVTNKALDDKFYQNDHVNAIDRYMRCHKKMATAELLLSTDYAALSGK